MDWRVISACAGMVSAFSALASLAIVLIGRRDTLHMQLLVGEVRAKLLELKNELIDRLNEESGRARDQVTPLSTEIAAMGARLGSMEDEVRLLRSAALPRSPLPRASRG